METTPLQRTLRDLEIAKENVIWLLEHSEGLVDMHGIEYWAGHVEKLRKAIKKTI